MNEGRLGLRSSPSMDRSGTSASTSTGSPPWPRQGGWSRRGGATPMRAGFTWLTMGNLPTSLPVTPAYAMVARSKSPLDFNAKAGPPDQARHCRWIL